MLRRLPPGLVALALPALAVLAAACSGGDRTSTSDGPQRSTTSTASAPTTSTTAPGDLAAARVALTPVASATLPTALASRPDDPTVYVGEQGGLVRAVVPGAPASTTVLDLTAQVAAGGERGLLGLTFSPDGDHVYVHYSAAGTGDTMVDEYAFTPSPGGGGTADPATRRSVLTVDQPQPNHNGGQLAFGPDGALYLGLGDGGSAGDQGDGHAPEGNGQSPDTLLGKLVRIDTSSGTAEVFASGLRNPWRFSFDPATDDLWIGDVGQGAREEIDRVPFAQARGANFGWPLLEGSVDYRGGDATGTVLPVFDVGHDTGACAIVGGSVYRGTKIPDLAGAYLFTDNCDGRIRALKLDDAGNVALERDLGVSVDGPTTFGVDDDGELYVASGNDGVFRIDPGMIRAAVLHCAMAAVVVAVAAGSGVIPATGASAQDSPRVRLTKIADVDAPTAMAFRAGDDTIYVAEQEGRVVAVRDDGVADEPLLDLRDRVSAGGEQGLLGLTFSPAGDRLYVHFTNRDGNARVEEYPVDENAEGVATVDEDERRVVLRIRDREGNHNGGQLAFGPDGELYLGMGDGGGAGDQGVGHAPGGNAQSTDTLLGKILRLDTDDGGAEICDLGLRNPWRFSFDRAIGDLWIADVGQSEWEEITVLPGDEPCGHNLGWNVFEGDEQYRAGQVDEHASPVAVLSHDDGNCSVIGGYVYRGTEIAELEGWYVFTDYCDGRLRALRVEDGEVVEKVRLGARAEDASSFGEDANGELYVASQSDGLFRVEGR